ncbi:MAG: hypothetical protein RBS07_11515 [Lentimicrobium sp.]|jgi:hypothetical protein|nr:hypothetical protein [Lentimicrobium sp.]
MGKKWPTEFLKLPISILLIAIFGWYYASVSIFQHTHIVNGVIVSHSHPYANDNPHSPIKGHKHGSSVYFLPDHPAGSMLISAAIGIAQQNLNNYIFLPFATVSYQSTCQPITSHGLRAPPFS